MWNRYTGYSPIISWYLQWGHLCWILLACCHTNILLCKYIIMLNKELKIFNNAELWITNCLEHQCTTCLMSRAHLLKVHLMQTLFKSHFSKVTNITNEQTNLQPDDNGSRSVSFHCSCVVQPPKHIRIFAYIDVVPSLFWFCIRTCYILAPVSLQLIVQC